MGKKRSDSNSDPKLEKKVQFYSKVKDAVTSSLSAKKSVTKKKSKQQRRQDKKLKAYNLSSLLESLPEMKASQKPVCEAGVRLNCKSRLKGRDQFSAFLKDPDFQADPLSAIHQHLVKKQPVVKEQPKKKVNKNGPKKKKKSKASTALQSMEM